MKQGETRICTKNTSLASSCHDNTFLKDTLPKFKFNQVKAYKIHKISQELKSDLTDVNTHGKVT